MFYRIRRPNGIDGTNESTESHPSHSSHLSHPSHEHVAPSARYTKSIVIACAIAITIIIGLTIHSSLNAQTRRQRRPAKPTAEQPSVLKYANFLHSSNKHKELTCNACHKIPTGGNTKREFPDVADFPDHNACVRCHRPQFFSGQAMSGTGPAICTVCHVRAAPREAARFAFGNPNTASLAQKPKED